MGLNDCTSLAVTMAEVAIVIFLPLTTEYSPLDDVNMNLRYNRVQRAQADRAANESDVDFDLDLADRRDTYGVPPQQNWWSFLRSSVKDKSNM